MGNADFSRLGLGTSSKSNRDRWETIVEAALNLGYRHIDTAQVYENEEHVGRGIANADVPREEVFLATKTVHKDVPGPDPDREDVFEAGEACLDRLGVEYVDMLYVHWPTGIYDPEIVLPAYDELVEAGLVRNVGLSNFTPDLLEEARDHLDAPIFAHQVEMHPLLQQDELVEYARENDHWLVAYSPLAKGKVFDVPELREIAEKHDATAAQVSLAWLLSRDHVGAIPRTMNEAHLESNFAARELTLDPEDRERIDGIEQTTRVIDPPDAPWNR